MALKAAALADAKEDLADARTRASAYASITAPVHDGAVLVSDQEVQVTVPVPIGHGRRGVKSDVDTLERVHSFPARVHQTHL